MHSWLNNVLIIGDPNSGDTRLLKIGMEQIINNFDSEIFVEPPDTVRASILKLPKPSLVFLVLDRAKLYQSTTGLLENQGPTLPIELAWQLAENENIVHVTVPSRYFDDGSFTPLDSLALSLSGISGIWEIEPGLLGQNVGHSLHIDDLRRHWRQNRILLYGPRVATQLYDFYERIMGDAWPTTVETRNERNLDVEEELSESQKMACFNLALGIATLEERDLLLDGSSKMNLDNLATRLSELGSRTGCWMGRTVISKYLGFLDRGWKERLPMHHDKKFRQNMPQWSRSEGFPKSYPLIRTHKHSEVGERLYRALDRLDFEREWQPSQNTAFTTISINMNRYPKVERE